MISMLILVGTSFANPCVKNDAREANSAEIEALYQAGEEDREKRTSEAEDVLKRDEKRAKQVVKLDKKGALCTPQDKWYAAWLMQQSDDLDVLERAYQLAINAMQNEVDRGPWLVAYSFDHKRVLQGYRQSFGTQTRVDPMGRRCLIELEGDKSDADRRKYGVPSLEKTYRWVLDANGKTNDPPTVQRMKRHSLICPPVALKKKDQRRVQSVR